MSEDTFFILGAFVMIVLYAAFWAFVLYLAWLLVHWVIAF